MQSLWMLLASLMFAGMGACVKMASDQHASLPQIVLFRGLPSVFLIFFWAVFTRRSLRPKSWRLHIARNVAGVGSMWMGFFAISSLPLATAVSLNYTSPLFIAGWILMRDWRQRDAVRTVAVVLGFLGVVAILRPSIGPEQVVGALVGLAAGACSAMAMMQVRSLGRIGEPEWRTVLYFSCFASLAGAVALAVEGWPPIGVDAWLALIGVGVFGLVGQLAMTRAFGLGSALLTAALQYTTIIFSALLAIFIWGDLPDWVAWSGMALIVASGMLSIWRTYSETRIMQGQPSAPVSKGGEEQERARRV
ncbi:DMT family transporter [Alcaligenaceae bacterium]|nr:DMT family transporter [Alcaligenaceae bacterium]